MKPTTLAMILAGGRVDDLSVLTAHRPKSAVPFGGFTRVIDFPLSNLMQSGLERVAILSQYRSFSLINHIGSGVAWDMLGRYRGISILPPSQGFTRSRWYRGSADAVYQNLDFVQFHQPETILILSGDHIYNMDYREIIKYHRAKNADLTMACKQIPLNEAHRFGLAQIDDEDGESGGRILNYTEKPATPLFNWASLTVFCFKPEILYEVLAINTMEDNSFEFGCDIIPRLMAAGRRVYGFKHHGYWGYTRTLEEYWQSNMDLLGDKPKIKLEEWGVRTNLEKRDVRDCQPLTVGKNGRISNSLIYNGCNVEGTVHNSILFPGTHIKPGATVCDSVLFYDNVVGSNCSLNKVISDVNVTFGADCRIGEDCATQEIKVTVIGWNNDIPANTVIGSGCTIYPSIPPGTLAGKIKNGEVCQ